LTFAFDAFITAISNRAVISSKKTSLFTPAFRSPDCFIFSFVFAFQNASVLNKYTGDSTLLFVKDFFYFLSLLFTKNMLLLF
jgi:hypothetical protein